MGDRSARRFSKPEFTSSDTGIRRWTHLQASRCSLNDKIIARFLSFEVTTLTREYTFAVREPSGELREYVLTIENEAFRSGKVRYQDASHVCCLRLYRELADVSNVPTPSRFSITDTELAEYKASTTPKPLRPFQMHRGD